MEDEPTLLEHLEDAVNQFEVVTMRLDRSQPDKFWSGRVLAVCNEVAYCESYDPDGFFDGWLVVTLDEITGIVRGGVQNECLERLIEYRGGRDERPPLLMGPNLFESLYAHACKAGCLVLLDGEESATDDFITGIIERVTKSNLLVREYDDCGERGEVIAIPKHTIVTAEVGTRYLGSLSFLAGLTRSCGTRAED
ncbi:MAG: hypothetical protein LBS17_03210 [Actinomycetes bacterium]|nr:hypothetical protein [Actinomycetes bacterium]